jgi:formylglycine-generating enzyme required for sulfatase activity
MRLRKVREAAAHLVQGGFAVNKSMTAAMCFAAAMALLTAQPRAVQAQTGASIKDCTDVCPEMVTIPAGRFVMGSPAGEKGRFLDEEQHAVTIAKPFLTSRYDVTRGEFAQFVAETHYDAKGSGCTGAAGVAFGTSPRLNWENPGFAQSERDPVVCVNWADAQAYADWLRKKTGKPYRLLTETEWEYAARAGTATAYPWGDAPSHDNANYGEDDCCAGLAAGRDQWMNTSPVGSFPANGFGLYDMNGNVWQWTQDCYHAGNSGGPADGAAWTDGDCDLRMLRGGAWFFSPVLARSANRVWFNPENRYVIIGFRVARSQ